MMKIYRFEIRRLLPMTLLFTLMMMLLTAGATLLFSEANVQALSEARAKASFFFQALGLQGSATLTQHLSSLLYGLLLPLLGGLYAVFQSSRLVADKVETGEMAYYLALPVGRVGIALTHCLVLLTGLFILTVLHSLGGIAACALLAPGRLQIGPYLWLNLGLWLTLSMTGGLAMLINFRADERRHANRAALLICAFFGLLCMLGRPHQMPYYAQFLSFYSLYDFAGLAQGRLDFRGLLMPVVALAFMLAGLRVFSKRELPL
jgi:ABC-type transport system involved in multi-copper enzyme maturation permease subunit